MGEASSVKVSDREILASCHLGDTFKVWSLVYTWRYSLQQDESIGFVVEQWLGKSSGSRRVWSCAELPSGDGAVSGGAQPFLGRAYRKGTFWAISLCPWLSEGISASLDPEHQESLGNVGRQNHTWPREGSKIWICRTGWFNQTNKKKLLFIAMQ